MRKSTALKIRAHIENAVQSLDNAAALGVVTLYPKWCEGADYPAGMRVQHNGKLYLVKEGKTHRSQIEWTPDVATSLFERIDAEHTGTAEDPIPYDGNMELHNGLYYTQGDVIYHCNRDTETAVYQRWRTSWGFMWRWLRHERDRRRRADRLCRDAAGRLCLGQVGAQAA